MKYFALKNANELHLTGNVYPQIKEHRGWCHENYEFLSYEIKPGILPVKEFTLDYLVLEKAAILTDLLSDPILTFGLLISKKFKLLLEQFNLPPHIFYNARVVDKTNKNHNYNWFFPHFKAENYINLNSTFQITQWFDENEIIKDNVVFSSPQDIQSFASKEAGNLKIKPKSVTMQWKEFKFDIFRFGSIYFDWIITERLKNKLEEEKITGYEVKEIDWLAK